MRQPPTYAGTKGREPCPACEGRGTELPTRDHQLLLDVCVVCNGTRVRPMTSSTAASRRSARVAGIRRAQRAR